LALEVLILRYYLKIFSIIFFVTTTLVSIYIYNVLNRPIKLNTNIVTISKGDTLLNIIDKNFDRKITNKLIYKYFYKIHSFTYKKSIHFGEFFISENSSFIKILETISKPSNILNKITIVEGWSKNDLENELSKHFKNFESIEYNQILADTYYYNNDENFIIFDQKLKNFKMKYLDRYKNNNLLNDYSFEEIIIIGSMIEKEGLDFNDKRKISSVIFNRLNNNMRLQIDATVIYAITNGNYNLNRQLLYSDLKVNDLYNTYVYKGLPPGPISYVGTKTIDIIFENYKTDFLFYFFNDKLKKHIFSKNYNEHKMKLNEYRKNK